MPRVDYSELVEALQKGDQTTANELLDEVMPRIVDYLCVVMNASKRDANECSQQAFLDVFEQIRKDKIKEHKYILSYITTSARNNYLRYQKKQHRFNSDPDEAIYQAEPAEQIENLIDKERMEILKRCLQEMNAQSRKMMEYFMNYPDITMKEAGKKFGLSYSNIRTKKSRLTHRLHHCYKRKSSD